MEKEIIAVAYEILLFSCSLVHFSVPLYYLELGNIMILVPPPSQALRLFFARRRTRNVSDWRRSASSPVFSFPPFFARKFSSREGRLDPAVRNLISANLILNF